MPLRKFRCTEGGAGKFWHIVWDDTMLTVHHGRLGTEGQFRSRDFPDAAQTTRHAERLIEAKLRDGYYEAGKDGRPLMGGLQGD